ncbi:LytR family transcriptional regulator, partial [Streptomyces sp. NPDC093060]
MSDPWDGPGGQATRDRSARVPGPRTGEPDGPRPGGRAASRSRAGVRSRRRARAGRGKRVLKIAAVCLSLLVLGTAGVGWWFYQHLNGNIQSVSLDGKGGTEKADAFGR